MGGAYVERQTSRVEFGMGGWVSPPLPLPIGRGSVPSSEIFILSASKWCILRAF